MYDTEEHSNLTKAKAQYADQQAGIGGQAVGIGYRRTTPREEAEKQVAYMQDEIIRKQQAVAFLTANPTFDEFITLIRKGVIAI